MNTCLRIHLNFNVKVILLYFRDFYNRNLKKKNFNTKDAMSHSTNI